MEDVTYAIKQRFHLTTFGHTFSRGNEDANCSIKQRFHQEVIWVRSWQSIRRPIHLVALAIFWLNFSG